MRKLHIGSLVVGVAIGLGFAAVVLRVAPAGVAVAADRVEYKIVTLPGSAAGLDKVLNENGADGWRLVALTERHGIVLAR